MRAWPCRPPWARRSAINFQPTGDGKAAITGDFVLLASEVDPVLAALRASGHRGDRAAQSHARRSAPHVLRAFLGQRRCGEARTRGSCGTRQGERRQELSSGGPTMDRRGLLLAVACAASATPVRAQQPVVCCARACGAGSTAGRLPAWRAPGRVRLRPGAWWMMPACRRDACWRRPARIRPTIDFRWRSTTAVTPSECRGHGALQGRCRPGRSCRRHRCAT